MFFVLLCRVSHVIPFCLPNVTSFTQHPLNLEKLFLLFHWHNRNNMYFYYCHIQKILHLFCRLKKKERILNLLRSVCALAMMYRFRDRERFDICRGSYCHTQRHAHTHSSEKNYKRYHQASLLEYLWWNVRWGCNVINMVTHWSPKLWLKWPNSTSFPGNSNKNWHQKEIFELRHEH